jgi:GPH family glycoside/pentoside/hexuronide:cation symporter
MIGAGFSALWILISSMLADTCDFDEITSHLRREGIYGAMFGWVSKLGVSLAFFLSGVTLNITGFDVKLGGDQSAATFLWMRILAAGVAAAASLIAAFLIHKYPITEEKAYEIRAELEARKSLIVEADAPIITS